MNRMNTVQKTVEHKTAIQSSAKTLHHETIFQFCDHFDFKVRCKLNISDEYEK